MNKDLGMNTPYADLTFNTWLNRDNYRVIYLDEANQNSNMYRKLLSEHHYNTIYLNSLFSVRFTLLPLWAAIKLKSEIVLAPRGMLGEGALNIKKIKKQLFLALFKFLKIAKRVTWHATAETESEEIKQHFGNDVKINIAPNLSSKTKNKKIRKAKKRNELHLFFLSRIAEKKNLKAALFILSNVNTKYNIEYTIIGPIGEPGYWHECQQLIASNASNILK